MSNADMLARPTSVDISTHAFARRFGALLREHRIASGRSLREVARAGDGGISARELRRIEAAEQPLGIDRIALVTALYGADLDAITPLRTDVVVRSGVVACGPAERRFADGDADALFGAYLDLVRSLRRERDSILVLRRDDVDVLAEHLRMSGKDVLDRLLAMMGSTRTQRSAALALFATGVMVIGLVSSAAATDTPVADVPLPPTAPTTATTTATTTASVTSVPATGADGNTVIESPLIVSPTAMTVAPAATPSPPPTPTPTPTPTTAPTASPDPAPSATAPEVDVAPPPVPTTEPTIAPPPSVTVPPLVETPPPDQDTGSPPIPGG
jgi:hypothetical protein